LANDTVELEGQKCNVFKSTWTMLINAIQSEHQKQDLSLESSHSNRFFFDLIYAFQFHGFFVGEWFSDNKLKPLDLSSHSLAWFTKNKQDVDSERWLYSFFTPCKKRPQ
jgi:hypothetical protein